MCLCLLVGQKSGEGGGLDDFGDLLREGGREGGREGEKKDV